MFSITANAHEFCRIRRATDRLNNSIIAFHYPGTVESTINSALVFKTTNTGGLCNNCFTKGFILRDANKCPYKLTFWPTDIDSKQHPLQVQALLGLRSSLPHLVAGQCPLLCEFAVGPGTLRELMC